MGYTIAILAVILGAAFWYAQRNTRRQNEWREAKQRDIEVRRAKIAARKKAEKQEQNDVEQSNSSPKTPPSKE